VGSFCWEIEGRVSADSCQRVQLRSVSGAFLLDGCDLGSPKLQLCPLFHGFIDGAPVRDAEMVTGEFSFEILKAQVTLGLEPAQFGDAPVEEAVALRAGAVDGELDRGGGFVLHGVGDGAGFDHGGFDFAAAAEAPHGAADFVDEVVFEAAFWKKFGAEGLVEFVIRGLFTGTDEVFGGEEAMFGGVFGGGRFTGAGAGSGGVLGVGLIRCEFRG
jgi:hypothetical protein